MRPAASDARRDLSGPEIGAEIFQPGIADDRGDHAALLRAAQQLERRGDVRAAGIAAENPFRARQHARFARLPPDRRIRTNAEADGSLLEEIAAPEPEGRKLLHDAAERMRLSARGYHRALRVARTLADLDNSDTVRRLHIAEAVSYRRVVASGG